jgi:hypothetical protein
MAENHAVAGTQQTKSPENLDLILKTTRSRGWWALGVVSIAIAAVVVWCFVATVPQTTSFTAVVDMEAYSHVVSSPATGIFTFDNSAILHQNVEPNQVIGFITPFDGSPNLPVEVPVKGTIQSLSVMNGESVSIGQSLLVLVTAPNPTKGVVVVGYVPAQQIVLLPLGQNMNIELVNPATDQVFQGMGKIMSKGQTPASITSLSLSSDSPGVVQSWQKSGGGVVYAVRMQLNGLGGSSFLPAPGALAQVSYLYSNPHFINIMFGGK